MLLLIAGPETIIQTNESITSRLCDPERRGKVAACLSSFAYYATLQEQITSIVVSLAKGHFFVDGNKRTSFIIYALLCRLNSLKCLAGVDRQVEAFVGIAETRKSISEYVAILFPGHT